MKHIALLGLLLGILFSCNQEGKKSDANSQIAQKSQESVAILNFEKLEHNFNQISTGEKVAYSFKFTNTGSAPLLITGTQTGCGCTAGDYPKEPIKPGEQGKINVVFNSAGRKGFQSESIRVLNNSKESPVTLRITAEVFDPYFFLKP
jgi:hypothetical protein